MQSIRNNKTSLMIFLSLIVMVLISFTFLSQTTGVKAATVESRGNIEAIKIPILNATGNVKKNIHTKESLDAYFSDLDGSQKVLELPQGGFVSTKTPTPDVPDAIITDESGNRVEYDVDTDPRAETVDEVKARLLNTPIKYE